VGQLLQRSCQLSLSVHSVPLDHWNWVNGEDAFSFLFSVEVLVFGLCCMNYVVNPSQHLICCMKYIVYPSQHFITFMCTRERDASLRDYRSQSVLSCVCHGEKESTLL
jgi:hypothetical protein